ncbi:MAG: radical SAM protein [Candidatus Omnitrophica bacterium]|nr:radical SAM protein [Candidatus Omnitrophota bacterium]
MSLSRAESKLSMPADVYEAFKKDFQNGIITLGDVCSANCFFCSQKWNPPHVLKHLNRMLTLEEIEHFMDRHLKSPAWIGSAIHVNSGEFFCHPHVMDVLKLLVQKKRVECNNMITFTNAMELTEEKLEIIKELNLCLHVSLHTTNISHRTKIMGGTQKKHQNAIATLSLLKKYKIHHLILLVPLKQSITSGDFEATVRNLTEINTTKIVVHRPGYTKYTPAHVIKELSVPDNFLHQYCLFLKKKYSANISYGFAMSDTDMNKDISESLRNLMKDKRNFSKRRKLFLYPASVRNVFPGVLKSLGMENDGSHMVKSQVFAGNVDCAGLLLVEDYLAAVKEFFLHNKGPRPEEIILPRASFDINDEDLSMTPATQIEKIYGTKVHLCGKRAN